MKFPTITFEIPPLPTSRCQVIYIDTDSVILVAAKPIEWIEWIGFPSGQAVVWAIIKAADIEFETNREPPCKNSSTSSDIRANTSSPSQLTHTRTAG